MQSNFLHWQLSSSTKRATPSPSEKTSLFAVHKQQNLQDFRLLLRRLSGSSSSGTRLKRFVLNLKVNIFDEGFFGNHTQNQKLCRRCSHQSSGKKVGWGLFGAYNCRKLWNQPMTWNKSGHVANKTATHTPIDQREEEKPHKTRHPWLVLNTREEGKKRREKVAKEIRARRKMASFQPSPEIFTLVGRRGK